MYKYSVIIPHKNCTDLLRRCLDSIPQRKDLEVIIVDDNSDVDFNNFPGKNRPNTTCIFNKISSGAGSARNDGLKLAKGHWVFFCDADDYVSSDFNNILNKYSDVKEIDMVFLNAVSIDENMNIGKLPISTYISNYKKKRPYSLEVLRYQFWAPWSRLIRREMMLENGIQFESLKVGNDVMGILNASKVAKTFSAESVIAYYYYKPSYGSQTDNFYNSSTAIARLDLHLRINKLYTSVGYIFLWPIIKFMPNKSISGQEEIRYLLSKNKYCKIVDFIYYIRYILGKLFKII